METNNPMDIAILRSSIDRMDRDLAGIHKTLDTVAIASDVKEDRDRVNDILDHIRWRQDKTESSVATLLLQTSSRDVEALAARVRLLEEATDELDVDATDARLDTLEQNVGEFEEEEFTSVQQALEDLDDQVKDLERSVEDLEVDVLQRDLEDLEEKVEELKTDLEDYATDERVDDLETEHEDLEEEVVMMKKLLSTLTDRTARFSQLGFLGRIWWLVTGQF